MKASAVQHESQAQLQVDAAIERMMVLRGQGRYQETLDIYLRIERTYPDWVDTLMWIDAASDCIYLARWQDAIRNAQTALAQDANNFAPYDALAQVHGILGHWEEARHYGLQALNIRARRFSGEPVIPLPEPAPMPPLPSAQTRERNIIALLLFGRDCKYCEPAILNAQEQPNIYPHWVCRFYVDASVPENVINRLRASGAQIVQVEGTAAQWAGPMWRWLALGNPQAHRILFRDADSVISSREAGAVEQWLASGKRFHMMRDWGSHTELILAGLWSAVAGSLPPFQDLMGRFMSEPLDSRRFADQHFLRQYVWPYARTSLMQHDSMFGFMGAAPFPNEQKSEGFHVGRTESSSVITIKTNLLNGSEVTWGLYGIQKLDNGQTQEKLICAYPGTVKEGIVKVQHIPKHYAQWLEQGTAQVRLLGSSATQNTQITASSENSLLVHESQIPLQVDAAFQQMRVLHEQGRYQEALDICLQIAHTHSEIANGWGNAAVNCVKLERWQDAIRYGLAALARGGGNKFELYDALAHAHSQLGQWAETRRYGLLALNMRDRLFGGKPPIPLSESGPMPPPPSAQTREHNIIAFSLFGRDCKYCEPAVLNVQDQPHIYPHWVCRFYVDDSVSESVIHRLREGGAQIVQIEGSAVQWPGPMWRLLALDDPQAHRILFRDADSVISQREAGAIEQWLASGKRFHIMRDNGACTELMQAGLWAVVAGSLPPLDQLIQSFMSKPLQSRHFADQFFLRQYIWPYARASLMQHDSVFGFMDAVPFPDRESQDGFHVGCADSFWSFTFKKNLPDGSKITWGLYQIQKLDNGKTQEKLICAYPGTVKDGGVKVQHIPMRYAQWLEQGTAQVRLIRSSAT